MLTVVITRARSQIYSSVLLTKPAGPYCIYLSNTQLASAYFVFPFLSSPTPNFNFLFFSSFFGILSISCFYSFWKKEEYESFVNKHDLLKKIYHYLVRALFQSCINEILACLSPVGAFDTIHKMLNIFFFKFLT